MAEEIAFDGSLYLPEAVSAAAEAYADHIRIELTPTADAVVAKLSDIAGDNPRTVVKAFCNHALYETIVRKRQAGRQEETA